MMLVDRIAESGWRLRRFPAVEAALYSAELLEEQSKRARRKAQELMHSDVSLEAEAEATGTRHLAECKALLAESAELREELNSPRYALGRVFRRDSKAPAGGAFIRLSRCEMLLERGFFRYLRELQRMQELRQALPPEPERQNEPTDAPNEPDAKDLAPSPGPARHLPEYPQNPPSPPKAAPGYRQYPTAPESWEPDRDGN